MRAKSKPKSQTNRTEGQRAECNCNIISIFFLVLQAANRVMCIQIGSCIPYIWVRQALLGCLSRANALAHTLTHTHAYLWTVPETAIKQAFPLTLCSIFGSSLRQIGEIKWARKSQQGAAGGREGGGSRDKVWPQRAIARAEQQLHPCATCISCGLHSNAIWSLDKTVPSCPGFKKLCQWW